MKSIFALSLLLGCLFVPIMGKFNLNKITHPGLTECLSDHFVTVEDLKNITKKPISEIDLHVKCAVKCALKKVGVVDDQGYLLLADLMGIFNDSVIKSHLYDHLSACQELEGETSCDVGFVTFLCIKDSIWKNI
ncbi:uncharacterized protein LOC117785001 [Drosophila innubila]|uniref:uncharacterized protein LOC117785001 n=1 Tax=Drosophila innubila TaxID=198719 RepID=UPI00148BCAE0|nr:uncharacterized protein LOC117785001 [Drosophila innubila]